MKYDKKQLVKNILGIMSGINWPKRDEITSGQLCRFFPNDIELGMTVANAPGIIPQTAMSKQHSAEVLT